MDINYFIAKYDYKIAEKLNPKNKKKNNDSSKTQTAEKKADAENTDDGEDCHQNRPTISP